ncbi:MAG: hypothetical protein IT294_04685 [Deltaproteobacteria bacterium]|nr:hypothetical protein [Deltaproteobacteria bacterium]
MRGWRRPRDRSAVFFLVSQELAFVLFADRPAPMTVAGGVPIVAGGLVQPGARSTP